MESIDKMKKKKDFAGGYRFKQNISSLYVSQFILKIIITASIFVILLAEPVKIPWFN